jgi:hypothetical protein
VQEVRGEDVQWIEKMFGIEIADTNGGQEMTRGRKGGGGKRDKWTEGVIWKR